MKRIFFPVMLVMMIAFWGSNVLAADSSPLGQGNIALKVDYFNFTDGDWEDLDLDDGLYLGVEAFGRAAGNYYMGAEIGYFNDDNSISLTDGTATIDGEFEVTFIPVEVNIKYALVSNDHFVFDIGGGVSLNYTELEFSGTLSDPDGTFTGTPGSSISGKSSEDDWLTGVQVFADVNFNVDKFFLGVNGKYQKVEEFDDFNMDPDNWRLGGQAGFKF